MSSGHATAFVSTTLPFWEQLDGAGFEEFCTTLLSLNPTILCEHEGKSEQQKVQSAARQLGGRQSQRGVDIRAKTDHGEEWLFQCKRVQSLGHTAVLDVIKEAEAGFPKADHYVLVITCGLNQEALHELLSHPKWMLWDSSRLTTET